MGEGEGRRGNTGRARARCGNVAELLDVGPRTAADRGKWVAVVVAVVVILVGRRISSSALLASRPTSFTLSPTRCHLYYTL